MAYCNYVPTRRVIYGVDLDAQTSLEFIKAYRQKAISIGVPAQNIAVDYALLDCSYYFKIPDVVMRGYSPDSSIEEPEWYQESDGVNTYTLGFELGGSGLNCNDDIEALMASKPTLDMKNGWKTVLGPILKSIGYTDKPKVVTTEQLVCLKE